MPPRAEDYPLYRNHTAMMQDLAYRVSRGYTHFTTGEIPPEKALRFVDKMHWQYGVLLSPPERSVLKKAGHSSAYLILQPEDAYRFTLGPLHWALLATGELEGEKLLDATKKRLRWRKHYRLVHKFGAWTWELTPETHKSWHSLAQANAKKADPREMDETLKRLLNFPMFKGIRRQVFEINGEAYRTWQRHHKDGAPGPDWPKKLPILRKSKLREDPPRTLERYLKEAEVAVVEERVDPRVDPEVQPMLEPVPLPLEGAAEVVQEQKNAPRMAQQGDGEDQAARLAALERQLTELESRNRELTEALERRDEEAEKKTRRWPWGR